MYFVFIVSLELLSLNGLFIFHTHFFYWVVCILLCVLLVIVTFYML